MRIGDLAKRSGTTERTLRYYEKQGLLHPSRDANGYRRYHDGHLALLVEIREMLQAGFTTMEIREFLPCFTGDTEDADCEAGMRRHLKKLREIDRLTKVLAARRVALLERFRRFGIAPEHVPKMMKGEFDAESNDSARVDPRHVHHWRR